MSLATRVIRTAFIATLTAGLAVGVGGTILAPSAMALTLVRANVNVNIRSGPGTSYIALGLLTQGSTATATGPASNGWYPIAYSGRTAYVSASYVTAYTTSTTTSPSPTPSPTPTPTPTTATAGTATALEALNVRSAPSLTSTVITVAPKGTVFSLTGAASGGFREVLYAGVKRWVSEAWILITPAPTPTASAAPSPSKTASTTPTASASAAPTASASKSPTASASTSATAAPSGSTSTSAAPSASASPSTGTVTDPCASPPLPKVTGQVRATAALMIRTTNDATFVNLGDVPAGTILDVTGYVVNGVMQIVYKCAVRWVNNNYIAALVPNLPSYDLSGITVVGQRYTLMALNVYTSSTATTATDLIPRSTLVPITGVVVGLRSEIVWSGARRYVDSAFLSTMAPSSATDQSVGLVGLTPNASKIVADVRTRFTAIFVIYGIRPDPYPDHPSGHAVDLMLPLPYTDAACQEIGRTIAAYYKTNAVKFGVQYIIFDQKIWNIERDAEGWRLMADRGSDNANHINHVHITVY